MSEGFANSLSAVAEEPATWPQRSLWLAQRLRPEDVSYNLACRLPLHGKLEAAAVERAAQSLIDRHPQLRTTFFERSGELRQRVHASWKVAFEQLDLAVLPSGERERRIAAEVERPFNLGSGPLIRVVLARLGPDEHLLLWVAHHMVVDGLSARILARDFFRALAQGDAPAPPLASYGDFAAWERDHLAGPGGRADLEHWRRTLQGGVEPVGLPLDRPRTDGGRAAGYAVLFPIEPALLATLSALAQTWGCTRFNLLHAAFTVLLHRLTGQEQLTVVVPALNRPTPRLWQVVGCFANLVPLRSDLRGNPTFEALVRQSREQVAGALDHQHHPLPLLLRELGLQPERRGAVFPDVSINLVSAPGVPAEEAARLGLRAGLATLDQLGAPNDLTLTFYQQGGALHGEFRYRTDLFARETIDRWIADLLSLLAEVALAPQARLSELRCLAAGEQALLTTFEAGTQLPPPEALLPEQVRARAREAPERTAVRCAGENVTYEELAERTAALARRLRALGVGREVRVALLLPPSIDAVVAVLAVLEAGGAYLPLDPGAPPLRLAAILADAGPALSITLRALQPRLPDNAPVLLLDAPAPAAAAEAPVEPASAPRPEDLAYVIYTSGSSGGPKGVCATHANLAWSTAARLAVYGAPVSCGLLLSPLAFDASVASLFWTLASGGTLVIPREGEQREPGAIAALIAAQEVTHLLSLPALYEQVLAAARPGQLASLRVVVVGGEPCPGRLAALHAQEASGAQLAAEYGPTEASVWCTVHLCGARTDRAWVPIGRPIPGTRVRVLGGQLQPAPVGAPGELCVSGPGVTRGYLRGGEAQQAFCELPASLPGDGGVRWYRTGDRARWLPGGELELLGRFDQQLKLRGHRVELEEVERCLELHPAVQRAAIAAEPRDEPPRWLVAHVVLRPGAAADEEALLAFVRERLPSAAVPARLVLAEALPLTMSGKLARALLPRVELSPEGHPPAAPRGPVEEVLAAVFRELLSLERLDRRENLFRLGADSLLLMQAIPRIRAALGREVALGAILDHPSVEELAGHLGRAAAATEPQAPLPAPEAGPPVLSFAQEQMWFLHQLEPGGTAYSMPAALRLLGPLDLALLEESLRRLVTRHENLRATFPTSDGLPTLRVAAEARLDLAVLDLRGEPAGSRGERLATLANREASAPFDLERGPLLRVRVLLVADDEAVVVVNAHHIVADQWSYGVLLGELSACYSALSEGREPAFPPLLLQHSDYARWQRRRLQGPLLDGLLAWWRARLDGLPVLELPADRPRPAVRSSRAGRCIARLPAPLLSALEALAVRQGTTPFMLLLACWQVLLWRYTGSADVPVGVPVAGRGDAALGQLVGPLVNTLVLRSEVDGARGATALLERVRAGALEAMARQELPFSRLVDELRPARLAGRTPLVQVLFNLASLPLRPSLPAGLTMGGFELEPVGAQFDLALVVELERSRTATLVYAADLFEPETAARMLRHYLRVLEQVAEAPERPLRELAMLDPDERQQELLGWNPVARPLPEGTFPEAFTRQAAAAGARVAVECSGVQLTYAELAARADHLARHLRRAGAGRGRIVAVLLERGLDLVVALLAVQRAGAAYLPLDPAHPAARNAHALGDSGAGLLITDAASGAVGLGFAGRVIRLDADAAEIARADGGAPLPPPVPDDAAYVIYTSGSTGKPKGVEVTHRGLYNFLLSMAEEPGLAAGDILLSVTTVSFDIQGLELWLPLLVGARVVVATEEQAQDGARLRDLLDSRGVTALQATPVTWRLLLLAGWRGSKGLKILCGGEAFPPDLAAPLLARGSEVWNLYGPTETTIWSAVHRVLSPEPVIPIGHPIANTWLYVLDERLEPAPPGVTGELYIGGEGVARGYLGRPELTAARFVADPFRPSQPGGGRMYRTGDLARRRRDGALECLGRSDDQVKLYGFRVESGEVEAALAALPGVARAAVVVRPDLAGNPHLTAFLVLHAGSALAAPGELRRLLSAELPAHMIPASFTPLPSLPITSSGKVDRRALRALELVPGEPPADASDTGARLAPRNQTERTLEALWAAALGVPAVGVRDNFFAVGGRSLLAAQLMAQVEARFGVRLPLQRLFQQPTVEGLAAAVDEAVAARSAGRPLPARLPMMFAVQPHGDRVPLFLVAGAHQRRRLRGTYQEDLQRYLSELLPHLGLDQPIHCFRPLGLFRDESPHRSVEQMAAAYLEDLRRLRPHGPYLVGGECVGGIVAYEMARQLAARGEPVGLLLLDTWRPTRWRLAGETTYYLWLRVRDLRNLLREAGRDRFAAAGARLRRRLGEVAGSLWYFARGGRLRDAWRFTDLFHFVTLLRYRPRPCGAPALLVANQWYHRDHPTLGWRPTDLRSLEVAVVQGTHETRLHLLGDSSGSATRAALDRLLQLLAPPAAGSLSGGSASRPAAPSAAPPAAPRSTADQPPT